MFHWCIVSIAVAAVIWYVLRKAIRLITSDDELVLYMDEFSGNIFSGVFIMELGVIATHNGPYSFAHIASGFIMLLIRNMCFTYESVSSFVDVYYDNGKKMTLSFFHVAVNIACQIAGMVIGQYMARFFWTFEDHTHTEALNYVCETAISADHTMLYVALIEFLGVFTSCLAATIIASSRPDLVPLTITTVCYINFWFFQHISGSFYNQSLATAFTFQCKGHRSDWEFFAIYWLAPTVGAIVAREVASIGKTKTEKTE